MKGFFQDGYPMLYSTRPAPVVRPGSPDILNLIVTMAIFVQQGTLVYTRRALTHLSLMHTKGKNREPQPYAAYHINQDSNVGFRSSGNIAERFKERFFVGVNWEDTGIT